MIPLRECKNRVLYRIRSKNLKLGVFCQETEGFIGLRSKCGYTFTSEEYHLSRDKPRGTVIPLISLPETLDSEIPLGLNNNLLEGWLRRIEKKYHGR